MNEIPLFLEILIYAFGGSILLMAAVVLAYGAWLCFIAPLTEAFLTVIFGERGYD